MSYEFNMVDMGGIDLATVNGTVVQGLYNKLLEGKDACGNLILYNWKFAEIEIVPSACSILIEDEAIIVNGTIRVDNSDVISLIWADPPPVLVEPITITENGVYTAQEPLSGYNPVSVNVPIPAPRIIPIVIEANGEYTPSPGVDGFGRVTVNVPTEASFVTDFDVLADEDYTSFNVQDMTWGDLNIVGTGAYISEEAVRFPQASSMSEVSLAYYDFGEDNLSSTIYVVSKVYEQPQYYQYNNLRMISIRYAESTANTQEFTYRSGIVYAGQYGIDVNTNINAHSYHLYVMRHTNDTKRLDQYIDFDRVYTGQYYNKGKKVFFAANTEFPDYYNQIPLEIKRVIITSGPDSSKNVFHNIAYLANMYNIN